MERYHEIDILKGIAVICMIIFHFFYFPNQYGFKEIEYNTKTLKIIAKVAQIIFITSVGINLVFSYYNSKTNNDFKKKQLNRIIKLSFYALGMSIFTYFLFDDNYVKFGILHFIAFSSLILLPFIHSEQIMKLLTIIFIIIYILKNKKKEIFTFVPEKIAFISGFYNRKYSSIDHFSLIPWIILISTGILLGHHLKENPIHLPDVMINNQVSNMLKITGKYSLEIYAIHWIVLYFIFCIIYGKYIR